MYDHFGLDSSDIINSTGSWHTGFKSGYILQHKNAYAPFVAIMSFDISFAGTI
ncbi:MAG: DUF3289 family protein [Oscillospiraceae bacterium]|nr:DUF3289 family protein [Oscillospiraceae bacterium]